MNHKIKVLGDWKVSKIPDLVDRLKEIHITQLLEIRGALHGRGNLELSDRAKHLRLGHELWLELSDDQRRKVFNRFVRFQPKTDVIESRDGQLRIPLVARLAEARSNKTSQKYQNHFYQ